MIINRISIGKGTLTYMVINNFNHIIVTNSSIVNCLFYNIWPMIKYSTGKNYLLTKMHSGLLVKCKVRLKM